MKSKNWKKSHKSIRIPLYGGLLLFYHCNSYNHIIYFSYFKFRIIWSPNEENTIALIDESALYIWDLTHTRVRPHTFSYCLQDCN